MAKLVKKRESTCGTGKTVVALKKTIAEKRWTTKKK